MVKVSPEEFHALDGLKNSGVDIQFILISHFKSFSGNGICMKDTWHSEAAVLNKMKPLKLAKALINGYELAN